MRSRRAGVARPPHRVTHSNASVRRSIGPACVHRLRNRPPGVARSHIRIPEECSSTDCVTEHDGRWSWPPRSWLVGFCLRLFFALVFALVAYLLLDMYAIALRSLKLHRDRVRSLKLTATLHCHCNAFVDAALRRRMCAALLERRCGSNCTTNTPL